MHRLALSFVFALFACQTSYSAKFQNEEGGFPQPSVLLKNSQGQQQALASIGRLEGAMSCTAFLWKPKAARPDEAAMAVTNGHCAMPYTDRSTTYEVWTRRPAPADWKLILNYFADTRDRQQRIGIQSILYSSMKSLDLALLELKISWAELERIGIQALPLAGRAPRAGSDIRIIGAPLVPFPEEERFLRESRCVEEARVSLVEWYWTWFDVHRNGCADIHEGASGSPILDADGAVYAVINTSSATGISTDCYLGNPCEVQEPGAFMVANKNYAIDIVDLPDCFAQEGLQFGSDCPLPSADSVSYKGAPPIPTGPMDADGRPLHWQVQADRVVWKLGAAGEIDCRNPKGFQEEALPSGPLPSDNGIHFLCLQKPGADARFPTVVVLSLDTRPPTLKPQLSIRTTENGILWEPIFQVPELSFYWVGHGPLSGTNCESLPLTPYRRIPLRVPRKDPPARLCVQGADHAGNRGAIFSYVIKDQEASGLLDRNVGPESARKKAKDHHIIRKE